MAEESVYSLSGRTVSSTYKGLLHFPHKVDVDLAKQYVYDGSGTKTSLQIGAGTNGIEIDGDIIVNGGSSVSNNLTIGGDLTINGNLSSKNAINLNDLTIGQSGSAVTLRALNQIQAGNVRIRETAGDYELIFGNPNNNTDPNIFTIKVDDTTNHFYIKNVYSDGDDNSPFWINKSTGEVNIKKLKTDNITNTVFADNKNANRNSVPVGEVKMFAASAAPDGYLKCDGSVYNKTNYVDLFNVIGQKFKTLTNFDTATGFQVPVIADLQTDSIIYIIKW